MLLIWQARSEWRSGADGSRGRRWIQMIARTPRIRSCRRRQAARVRNGRFDSASRTRSKECRSHSDLVPYRSSLAFCTRTTRSAIGRRRSRGSVYPAREAIRRCARTVRTGSAHSRPWEAARHAPRENATSTESTASRCRLGPAPCRSSRPPCTRTTGSATGRRRRSGDASQGP